MRKLVSFDQLHETNPDLPFQTAAILESLSMAGTDKLLGDEEDRYGFTGKHRVVAEEMHGRLSVAWYEDPDYMANVISEQIKRPIEAPVGHLQFEKSAETSSVAGALYVTKDGVVAYMEVAHDDNDPVSSAAEDCWKFTEDLGLGSIWTNSLFHYADDPANRIQTITATLTDSQTLQLNQMLEGYIQARP